VVEGRCLRPDAEIPHINHSYREAEVHIAGPTPGNEQHHSALLLRKCQNSQLLSWQSALLVGRCGVAPRSAMQLNSVERGGRFLSPESFHHPGYACCARDRKVCAYAHPKPQVFTAIELSGRNLTSLDCLEPAKRANFREMDLYCKILCWIKELADVCSDERNQPCPFLDQHTGRRSQHPPLWLVRDACHTRTFLSKLALWMDGRSSFSRARRSNLK
jgi:hypothetical protein